MKIKRLTVASIRNKFWDKKTKKGKRVRFYSGQDLSTEIPTNTSYGIFIPDGDLLCRVSCNRGFCYEQIIEDWLSKSTNGPYTKRNIKLAEGRVFFYLTGRIRLPWEAKSKPLEKGCLQVCLGPFNVLSEDCLDDIGCWIKK